MDLQFGGAIGVDDGLVKLIFLRSAFHANVATRGYLQLHSGFGGAVALAKDVADLLAEISFCTFTNNKAKQVMQR